MKIRYEQKSLVVQSKRLRDIPIDTVFEGTMKEPSLYLRAYDKIIDLADPSQTWAIYDDDSVTDVNNYHKVDAEIIVK